MKYIYHFKKIFSPFFIFLLMVPVFYAVTLPNKALAIPVVVLSGTITVTTDIAHDYPIALPSWLEAIWQSVKQAYIAEKDAITAKATGWLAWVKEFSLDKVAKVIAQKLETKILNEMIDFVQNGYSFGGAAFMTDPYAYYGLKSDTANQIFFSEMESLKKMVDPISLTDRILDDAEKRLEKKTYESYVKEIIPKSGEFPKGEEFPGGKAGYDLFINGWGDCPAANAWDCWMSAQNPKNDLFEAKRIAAKELETQRAAALARAHDEIVAGQGFHTFKTCVQHIVRNNTEYCIQELTDIPGQIIVGQLKEYLASAQKEANNVHDINEFVASAIVDISTNWVKNKTLRN